MSITNRLNTALKEFEWNMRSKITEEITHLFVNINEALNSILQSPDKPNNFQFCTNYEETEFEKAARNDQSIELLNTNCQSDVSIFKTCELSANERERQVPIYSNGELASTVNPCNKIEDTGAANENITSITSVNHCQCARNQLICLT